MPIHSGFFPAAKALKQTVDVGGIGDCGPKAIAAAMLDNILFKSISNEKLAKKLLELHAFYYVDEHQLQIPANYRLLSRSEVLAKLMLKLPERAKLIVEFSNILREVGVSQMKWYPERYRGAFVNENENTSPEKMRLPTTWIDETFIAAIAEAFNLPINVQVVKQGKELPMRLQYNVAAKNGLGSPVDIQLNDKHYLPRVHKPAYFSAIKEQSVSVATPKAAAVAADQAAAEDLTTILAKIAADEAKLLAEYTETIAYLTDKVDEGSLTKDDLLDMYIKGMATSDYLQGRVKYVGLEYKNQDFYNAIENRRNGMKVVDFPNECNDDLVTKALIQAIARAASIQQINPVLEQRVSAPVLSN